jgi:hypothetical protein
LSRLRSLRRFLFNDTVVSFLKIVVLVIAPLVFALLGLALLTSLPTALIWVASIVVLALLYVRFSDRHVEHLEYDDKMNQKRWLTAREKYFEMMKTAKNADRNDEG